MKILTFITRGDSIGGAQIHVRDLSNELKKRNHSVTVVAGISGVLTDELNNQNIRTIILKNLKWKINLLYDIKAYFEVRKLIKYEKPDLVTAHSSKCGIIVRLACFFLNQPNVFTIHGWSCADGVPKLEATFYRILETFLGFFTNHLITVCESDKELAIKKSIISKNKITTIHNGVNDLIAQKKELNHNEFTMVMPARFQKQKDHKTLILSLIPLNKYPWKLYFLGDDTDTLPEIKTLVSENNLSEKVEFVGFTKEVVSYINKSDIFLLISNWEGFPISILEAMSLKMPIIASNVGGVKEQVIDGYNGFLIERNNSDQLKEVLSNIMNKKLDLETLALNSRNLYLEKFTLQKMTDKTEILYKLLVSK